MASWNVTTRIIFRLGFIYFVLYIFPFPLGWIPFTEVVHVLYQQAWLGSVNWVGTNILSISYEITILPNGSGDTTYNYVLIFIFMMMAIIGTGIWTLFDYKRTHYEKLWYWFVIVLRYYLGIVLLTYGFIKIIQTQFPAPSLETLLQPYGESTSMTLLWTFMGYSKAYNVFVGLAEAGAGMLLLFKRTRLMGALMSIAVMSNVVVLNFCYNIPVKLLSTHLLVISVILLLPDIKRLVAFFVLNKPIASVPLQPVYQSARGKAIYTILKTIIVGGFLVFNILQVVGMQQQLAEFSKRSTLYGIYDVQEFILNGDTLPALTTDTRRWKRMYIHHPGTISIQYMDGGSIYWSCQVDSLHHTMNLASIGSTVTTAYNYQINHDTLIMTGGDPRTTITFLIKRPESLPLLNSKFNWINEYPDNR
jgi:hypothetical protein